MQAIHMLIVVDLGFCLMTKAKVVRKSIRNKIKTLVHWFTSPHLTILFARAET